MNRLKMFSLVQFFTLYCIGQTTILPGDKTIDKSKLKSFTYTMGYSVAQDGAFVEIGNYKTDINHNDKTFDVQTTLSFLNSKNKWNDHYVADANSFKPISSYSERDNRNLDLNFENEITGFVLDNRTMKKTAIKERLNKDYFDISIYPYIMTALPLASGYKANIPVYDYEAESTKSRYSNVVITDVKSGVHKSTFTGEHNVWLVSVFEESTKNNYQYHIDKETRKIWRIDIFTSKDSHILLINKETDFYPFKNKFDKEVTLKLITNGSAVISGQAFARDNKNGGALQGMAVLNVNKKQYAAKGTTIFLMPYTDYFKEWITTNESREKKLLPLVPLPDGAVECIKESNVYDNEGNFEFINLMPGEYLLTIKFIYAHSATVKETVGYTDNYINGVYQGSNDITVSHNFIAEARAKINKVVKITKEGEKVQVKLKKTL